MQITLLASSLRNTLEICMALAKTTLLVALIHVLEAQTSECGLEAASLDYVEHPFVNES